MRLLRYLSVSDDIFIYFAVSTEYFQVMSGQVSVSDYGSENNDSMSNAEQTRVSESSGVDK